MSIGFSASVCPFESVQGSDRCMLFLETRIRHKGVHLRYPSSLRKECIYRQYMQCHFSLKDQYFELSGGHCKIKHLNNFQKPDLELKPDLWIDITVQRVYNYTTRPLWSNPFKKSITGHIRIRYGQSCNEVVITDACWIIARQFFKTPNVIQFSIFSLLPEVT